MNDRRIATRLEDLADLEDLRTRSGLEFMQDLIAGNLAAPPIGATLNFWPVLAAKGQVDFEGTPNFEACNPMRGVHGGWYGAILDSCMACAVMTCVPKGRVYTTLEFKINITRAAPIGMALRATGLVTHAGRTTGVATGEVRGIEDGKLYATGSTTCIIMDAPPPAPDQDGPA
ncbi:PaaI family thioesterase [Rhodobacteraceae bacterium KMM 6894]|nr:PaaI family thioesterase [Rhodobacteraceae bacterium KMM 6894]